MPTPEVSGMTMVLNGAFNPAVFHPTWFADNGLLSCEAAQYAVDLQAESRMIVSSQFSTFDADWLTMQARQEQIVISIVEESREDDFRDFADGLMNLLPESPMDAMGINYLAHYRMRNEEEWHAFGDLFLPKTLWEGLVPDGSWFERPDGFRVGMRSLAVEVRRGEEQPGGLLRIDIAPSVRVAPYGVYCEINDHFAIAQTEGLRGSAGEYSLLLRERWTSVRESQSSIIHRIEEYL